MKFIPLFILTLLLASCTEENWTQDEQNDFVQACRTEGGTKTYCECYLETLMLNYPIAEDAEHIDFETKIDLAENCKK